MPNTISSNRRIFPIRPHLPPNLPNSPLKSYIMSSKLDNDIWYQWKHGAIKMLDGSNYEDWR